MLNFYNRYLKKYKIYLKEHRRCSIIVESIIPSNNWIPRRGLIKNDITLNEIHYPFSNAFLIFYDDSIFSCGSIVYYNISSTRKEVLADTNFHSR
jgi:hypothetical protein